MPGGEHLQDAPQAQAMREAEVEVLRKEFTRALSAIVKLHKEIEALWKSAKTAAHPPMTPRPHTTVAGMVAMAAVYEKQLREVLDGLAATVDEDWLKS